MNPRDRRVVICESVLCPTLFRETLAKVMFRHFEVCVFLFYSFITTLFAKKDDNNDKKGVDKGELNPHIKLTP